MYFGQSMKTSFQFFTGFAAEYRLLFIMLIVIILHLTVFLNLRPPFLGITKTPVFNSAEKNVLSVTMVTPRSSKNLTPVFAEKNSVNQDAPQRALKSRSATAPINTPKDKPSQTSKSTLTNTHTKQDFLVQERVDFSSSEYTPVYLSRPRFKHSRPQPNYPQHARRMRLEGLVVIRVVIGKSGRVTQATVHQSSGSESLDAAAKEASLLAQFYPYLKDGVAYASQADLPYRFVLK